MINLPQLYPLTVDHVCQRCEYRRRATYLSLKAQLEWTRYEEEEHLKACDGTLTTLIPEEYAR